jgi:hypothetical protein
VTPFVRDADFTLYHGDARRVLLELDAGVADCIVTSPPYYLLRDYDVDGQIGVEETLAEYVEALVDVFRRRAACSATTAPVAEPRRHLRGARARASARRTSTLDAGAAGARLAGREQARPRRRHEAEGSDARPVRGRVRAPRDGWWLRQVIVWDKPNPIPESAKDRPTTSHEYVLLLSKSRRYFYDADAIAEPATWERWGAQTMQKDVVGKARDGEPAGRPRRRQATAAGVREGRRATPGRCGGSTARSSRRPRRRHARPSSPPGASSPAAPGRDRARPVRRRRHHRARRASARPPLDRDRAQREVVRDRRRPARAAVRDELLAEVHVPLRPKALRTAWTGDSRRRKIDGF